MAYVPKDESSVGINYFEYNVEKKKDGKTRLQRFGIVCLDIALAILLFIFIPSNLILIAFCGFALVFAIITFFLYKRTQIEYEYEINTGEMTMSIIYGGRSRKELFSQKISSFTLISTYTEENFKRATFGKNCKIYNCVSSPDAAEQIFVLFKDEGGNDCCAIFQAPKKAVSIMRFYNASAIKM